MKEPMVRGIVLRESLVDAVLPMPMPATVVRTSTYWPNRQPGTNW